MCTAIRSGSFAGRNLDIDRDYGGEIIVVPKNYPFTFKRANEIKGHYAFIGMGVVNEGFPLFFDAANENGLYVSGLNFVGNAKYRAVTPQKNNLAPYELIPYLLSKCATVKEAEYELEKINLIGVEFTTELKVAELHFFIADKGRCAVVECDKDGLKVYDNPVGVLTNNPPFPIQLFNLNNYMGLSSQMPENRFSASLNLDNYSYGMGAIGLPGDLSSTSRFVRAAFHSSNCKADSAANLFHLLSTVMMPEGSVKTELGFERTEFSSCVDLNRLIYYYRHYDSLNTRAVHMNKESLDGDTLIRHEIKKETEPYI